MSADHVPHTAEAAQAVSDPPQVEAEYAEWAHVMGPDEHQPLPSLVLGNHGRELHLELTAEQLDELLVDLAGQVQSSDDAVAEEPDRGDRPTWASRAGARALSASGWRTTDQWWRTSTSNTRIIVVGAIVAVMVLGLLVTF